MVHGFSCYAASGSFLGQGLNLCLLHGQVDSPPLSHHGSPGGSVFTFTVKTWSTHKERQVAERQKGTWKLNTSAYIYTKKKHFIVTLESPLDCKEIQPVHPKGNQFWIFTGRTDAEAPILWPPHAKSQLTGKDLIHWKRLWWWARLEEEEKGTTEDEMVGWHHRVNRHEFEQAPEVDDGEGRLACRSPWGRRESDTTEWVNNYSVTEWSMLVLKHFLTTRKRITLFK